MKHFGSFLFFLTVCGLVGPPIDAVTGQPPGSSVATSAKNSTSVVANYDVAPRPVQLVPPGTVVGNTAPPGWSHLVIKSLPRCTNGDVEEVAKRDVRLSSQFGNVFLVKMAEINGQPWAIQTIAFGVTVPVDGKDVVVAPQHENAGGAKIGILAKVLLKEIVSRQRQMPIRVRSPHFAIVDVNAAVRFQETNQQMFLRYALVADADERQLHAFVWLLKPGSGQHTLASTIRELGPNCVESCTLHVDKSEYSWGLPSDNAFAVTDIPKGIRAYQALPQMVPAMQRRAPTMADAALLDRELRKIIAHHQRH